MASNRYTVCFLFDQAMENVLLVQKEKTIYKGKWNGIGGKFENGESPWSCAKREIKEETGVNIHPDDLIWLGTTFLPQDCVEASLGKQDVNIELHFYAAIIGMDEPSQQEGEEKIQWTPIVDVFAAPFRNQWLAGDGDVQYWAGIGYAAARRWQKENQPNGCNGDSCEVHYDD